MIPSLMIVTKQDLWGRRYVLIRSGCPILRNRETINKFFDALPNDTEIVGLEHYNGATFKLILTSSFWDQETPYPEIKLTITNEIKVTIS